MRLGIILRAIGIALIIAVVSVLGAAVQHNAFVGESQHYTVVLASSEDANSFARAHKSDSLKVGSVVSDGATQAITADMSASDAKKLESTKGVSYMVLDSKHVEKHTLWDTVKIATGLDFPSFS